MYFILWNILSKKLTFFSRILPTKTLHKLKNEKNKLKEKFLGNFSRLFLLVEIYFTVWSLGGRLLISFFRYTIHLNMLHEEYLLVQKLKILGCYLGNRMGEHQYLKKSCHLTNFFSTFSSVVQYVSWFLFLYCDTRSKFRKIKILAVSDYRFGIRVVNSVLSLFHFILANLMFSFFSSVDEKYLKMREKNKSPLKKAEAKNGLREKTYHFPILFFLLLHITTI